MADVLLQLLSIARERWAFSAAGLVRLLEKVMVMVMVVVVVLMVMLMAMAMVIVMVVVTVMVMCLWYCRVHLLVTYRFDPTLQPADYRPANQSDVRPIAVLQVRPLLLAPLLQHAFSRPPSPPPSPLCSPDCSCAGGSELPILFTKFASYLETDALLISRPLLLKSSVLCAEVRLLLQRTLLHAQSLSLPPLCQLPLQKFGLNLRSIVCSLSHLLLQIIKQTDEALHGSGASAALLRELLLLAQFLHTCLALPAVASSYSACTSFIVPDLLRSLVSRDTTPSMTLPQRLSDLLFKRCHDNLRRCALTPPLHPLAT
jgi:hypothetical protein